MNDFYNGILVGFTQTLVGQPFDTLKVIKQTSKINYKRIKFLKLYRGVSFPLIGSGLYNSIQFGLHDMLYKNNISHFFAGAFGGFCSSIIINPLDIYKINYQLTKKKKLHNLCKGLHLTIIRESFATGIYFGSYFYFFDLFNKNSFLSGGCSGICSWFFTYPLDVSKSRIMSYKTNSFIKSIKMGNLWHGLEFCLLRAFIVNGCGFFVFNQLIK